MIMSDKEYWEQFIPLLPKGWKLIGYTFKQQALYGNEKESMVLTSQHTEMIKTAIVAGRMDSKFEIKE